MRTILYDVYQGTEGKLIFIGNARLINTVEVVQTKRLYATLFFHSGKHKDKEERTLASCITCNIRTTNKRGKHRVKIQCLKSQALNKFVSLIYNIQFRTIDFMLNDSEEGNKRREELYLKIFNTQPRFPQL